MPPELCTFDETLPAPVSSSPRKVTGRPGAHVEHACFAILCHLCEVKTFETNSKWKNKWCNLIFTHFI